MGASLGRSTIGCRAAGLARGDPWQWRHHPGCRTHRIEFGLSARPLHFRGGRGDRAWPARDTSRLPQPFTFYTLEPFDYEVRVSKGGVVLRDSAVESGRFEDDRVVAPLAAVRDDAGAADRSPPTLDSSLTRSSIFRATRRFHRACAGAISSPVPGRRATMKSATSASPLSLSPASIDRTTSHSTLPERLSSPAHSAPVCRSRAGCRDLPCSFPSTSPYSRLIRPAAKPIEFVYGGNVINEREPNWFNVSYDGVHGRLNRMLAVGGGATNTDLGPIGDPLYEGNEPFRQSPTPIAHRSRWRAGFLKLPHYRILMRFVSSATFESDMRGILKIPNPVDSDLEFSEMVFTSTARNAGRQSPVHQPHEVVVLGRGHGQEAGRDFGRGAQRANRKVLFTAAGIHEPRHFQQPFYLVWGEMRADGGLQRLVFDYNSAGQRFDRFLFTTTFVRLSDYVPTRRKPSSKSPEPFISISSAPSTSTSRMPTCRAWPGDPFNSRRGHADERRRSGRRICCDGHAARSQLERRSRIDELHLRVRHCRAGRLPRHRANGLPVGGRADAGLDRSQSRADLHVGERHHRHDSRLGPVAHLGAMSRITGCACLEAGQLQRATLSSELEVQEDVNIALRAASYGRVEWMMTPSVTSVEVAGDMYLTILLGGNVQVTGRALFTVDRAQDFVEGEVDGRFDTGTALGLEQRVGQRPAQLAHRHARRRRRTNRSRESWRSTSCP